MDNEEFSKLDAIDFFSDFYGGSHHIPGHDVKEYGLGWYVDHDRGEMATFDFSQLTKLVVMCHDRCIRGGIESTKRGVIRISIFKRKGREGGMSVRHPELEKHVEIIRSHLTKNQES